MLFSGEKSGEKIKKKAFLYDTELLVFTEH